jgi:fibronectin-binding autotransporter adhesin
MTPHTAQTLRSRSRLPFVLALAVGWLALTAPPAAAQTTYTWTATASGNFSTPGNWLTPPGVPVSGSGTILQFLDSGLASYTATQDLAPNFVLNALIFNSSSAGSVTVTNAAGNGMSFSQNGSALPALLQNNSGNAILGNTGTVTFTASAVFGGGGTGAVTVSSPVVFGGAGLSLNGFNTTTLNNSAGGGITLPSGGLTITGNGVGNVVVSGAVVGTPASLTINTGSPSLVTGFVQLSGNNTFTTGAGGVVLQSGNLVLGSGTALGAAANTLTVNGGAVRLSFTSTVPNNVVLNNTLTLFGTSGLVSTGVISGSGGVQLIGSSSNLTLQNADTYSGPTVVGLPGISSPSLTINGNGSILNTSSITLNGGPQTTDSILTLSNAATVSGDRVPAAPITLNYGRVNYAAGTGANSETFGPLTVNGFGTVAATVAAGTTSTSLTFGNLTRPNNATMAFRGPLVGGAPSATTVQLTFANAATAIAGTALADPLGPTGSTNLPIVPWAVGDASGGSFFRNFVTPDGAGVRPLADTEFSIVPNGGALVPNTNNLLNDGSPSGSSPAPLPAGATVRVNSLRLDNPAGNAYTIGGGAGSVLQVYSGAITNFWPTTFGVPTLDFGPRTGYFFAGDTVALNSSVTGSAGVVVTAFSTLSTVTLGANNPFTGGLTINGAANVQYSADNQLGAAGGALTFGGGTLVYTGSGPLTLSRPILLTPANGAINVADGNAVLTVDTTGATGPGNLIVTGVGTVALTGTSGATGGTIVSSATLQVTSAGSLGAGPLTLNSGRLQFAGAAAPFNKNIVVNQSSTIDVGTLNPTISGVISTLGTSGSTTAPALTKTGTGTLSLTGANTFAGPFVVAAGGLTLSGAGQLPNADPLVMGSGTTLTLDNTATNLATRLAGPLSLLGSNVIVLGNAAGSTASFGTLSVAGGSNFLSLVPAAGSTARATAANFGLAAGQIVFRGPGLGTAGANGTQVFFTTPPVLSGGLVVGALGDTDPVNGAGSFLVGYDPVLGVVPAVPGAATAVIQNNAPTNTPTNANILTAVPQTVTRDAANTINSLTLQPGSTLTASVPASSTLTVTSGMFLAQAGGPSTIAAAVTLNAPANTGFLLVANGNLTVGSTFTGGNGNFTKGGNGTLTLSAANTFAGTLSDNAGTLALNANTSAAQFTGAGNLALANGTTLTLTGGSSTFGGTVSGGGAVASANPASTLTFNGANTFTGGVATMGTLGTGNPSGFGTGPVALTNIISQTVNFALPSGTSGTVPNNFSLANTNGMVTFAVPAGITGTEVTLSGVISGSAGNGLQFAPAAGSGNVFKLTNANNSFTAPTVQVFEGFLAITSNAALGAPSNALDLSATNPGGLRFDANNIDINRPVSVSFSQNTVNTNGNAARLSGVLSGSAGLIVAGGGTLTVSNAGNTFTGPVTVNAGTRLLVDGTLATDPTNAVTVNGTLGGTGTINRPVAVNSGGTLAPGDSPGVLTVTKAVTLTGGSTFLVELNGPTPGNGPNNHDQLNLTGGGSISLGGATLAGTIGGGYTPAPTDQLFIINGGAVTGTFANGSTVNLGSFNAQIVYNPTSVVLTGFLPVPEPAHLLLLCGGAAGALGWWRRRRTVPAVS